MFLQACHDNLKSMLLLYPIRSLAIGNERFSKSYNASQKQRRTFSCSTARLDWLSIKKNNKKNTMDLCIVIQNSKVMYFCSTSDLSLLLQGKPMGEGTNEGSKRDELQRVRVACWLQGIVEKPIHPSVPGE